MHHRLYRFLELLQLLFNKQFGSREVHSTDHALVTLTENIKFLLGSRIYGCRILIDLQKEFDTVSHDILHSYFL